jgi:hypothetical protein
MVSDEDRLALLRRLRHPQLDTQQRKHLQKEVISLAKKRRTCPACHAVNGICALSSIRHGCEQQVRRRRGEARRGPFPVMRPLLFRAWRGKGCLPSGALYCTSCL